ncbi:MAG: Gfo/Idh/MocA family oxidoreductase [Armatimonadota bacterium]
MQRVAIVGAGGMAGVHGAAYAKMPNVKPVAVVDVIPEAAAKLAGTLGVPSFTNFDEMLKSASPDVVDICTPTPFHKEYAIRAMEARKHVVLEKPMARTLADCRAMIDAANRTGVKFMVAHVVRFFPEFAAIKEQVESGAVGKPAVVRTTRGGGHPGRWFADYDQSGGVILDTIIHDFDWLRITFGEVDTVFAKGLIDRCLPNLDYALVTLRMKNNVIAHVEGNWAYSTSGFSVKVEVAGDEGLIDFDNKKSVPLVISAPGAGGKETVPQSPLMEDPYYRELKAFIDCVESDTPSPVSGEEGMRAVEIALAAIESIRTGKPVKVGG